MTSLYKTNIHINKMKTSGKLLCILIVERCNTAPTVVIIYN